MTTRLRVNADLGAVSRLSLKNNPINDVSPPVLTTTYNFVSNQKVDESFALRFNENIEVGTGDIILSNGIDTRIIDITDTRQVTFNNSEGSGHFRGKGNVIINPLNDLIPDTHYSVQIPEGAIQDTAGNTFEGIHNADAFSFNAIASNPLLTNAYYFNHYPIKIDQPIELSFDEPVMVGNGFLVISNGIDTKVIDIHDTSQVTFNTGNDFNQTSVIISPTLDLAPNTEYSLWMSYGAITDLAGNPFLGASMMQPIYFNTISSDPLLIWNNLQFGRDPLSSFQNQHDLFTSQTINTFEDISKLQPLSITQSFNFESSSLTNTAWRPWGIYRESNHYVKANSNFELYFDETVLAGDGNIIISDGTNTRTINIQDSSKVRFNDAGRVTINPETDLLPDSAYTLHISHGTVVDIKNNPYTGLDTTDALSFTTIPTNPLLIDSEPWDEQSTFQESDEIFLLFDESVFAGDGSIIITSESGTRTIDIQDSSQVAFNGTFLTIDLQEDLQPYTRYNILITDNAIQNADGHFFTGITDPETLNFTTIPDEPFLRLDEPLTAQYDEGIVLEFSELVTAGNGTIIISNESDIRTIDINDYSQITFNHNNVIVNPTTDLILNTQYSIQITNGAIADNDGNPFPGITDTETLRFTTTTTDPKLQFSIPPDDFSGFMTNWNIGLDFDENIMAGNGTITLHSDTDTRLIDIHDTNQVDIIHDKVIVNPSNDLLPNTHYSIQITPGAFTDSAGNSYAGIEDVTALDFTTSDAAQVFEFL